MIAIQNAMRIDRMRIRSKNRYLARQFLVSWNKVLEVLAKVQVGEKEIPNEFSDNAPPWIVELLDIAELASKATLDISRGHGFHK